MSFREVKLVTIKEMLDYIGTAKHLDQQGLAQLIGVNKSQITRWNDGAIPKIETQRKIYRLYEELKT